jgi:hypothetical protein
VERHLLWLGLTCPTHGLPWSSVGTPPSAINLRTKDRLATACDDDLLHRDMLARMIATKTSKALRHLSENLNRPRDKQPMATDLR